MIDEEKTAGKAAAGEAQEKRSGGAKPARGEAPGGGERSGGEKGGEERVEKRSPKKGRDKWRAKEWYTILAPEMFGGQQLAETLSADPEGLIGRVVSVSLQDITGDFSRMHIKLALRINRVTGFEAHTEFIGHDLTSDYIRRLTRRKHSKMDGVFTVRTKDGYQVKVKPMAITEKRIQTSQQRAIRRIMRGAVTAAAERQTLGELIREVLQGDMAKAIFRDCKPVYPIRKIEIRRTEVLASPEPGAAPAAAPAVEPQEPTQTVEAGAPGEAQTQPAGSPEHPAPPPPSPGKAEEGHA
ncbi:MAG: 30S ribosomal protein S3ae [Thermoplasmatota archaeon]